MADIEIVLNKINLDLKKSGTQATVHAKKGDIQSRAVIITFRADGNNYRVPDGVTAVFRAKKPDGTVIYNSATVQDGKVYFLLTSQYCAVAGKYFGEVQLIKSGKVLYAPKFAIIVEDNIYSDSEIESTNEYTQLTEAIEDAQEALETAQALQLIKYVTDLDDPGDKKYLYVLEEKEPYFTMTDFPTDASSAIIFETYGTVSNNYPFLAFTGMILQEETYSNPDVIEFRDWSGSPGATDNACLYGYKLSDEKWVLLDTFAYSGASALSQGDEIILTDESIGIHTPVISGYKIKSDPLYEIGNTRIVYIYDNTEEVDSLFYLVGRYSNQTYDAEDNVIDITDIPEILTNPTGIPYVYDEVTNQYVALLDATAESLLDRMTAAELAITAAENDIDNIEDELNFSVLVTLGNNPTINHTFAEIRQAVSNYGIFPVRIFYTENNMPKYANGYINVNAQLLFIDFKFDISTKDKIHTIIANLNNADVLTITDEYTDVQTKLTEGDNIEIDYTDPKHPVISSTGGGGGGGSDVITPLYYKVNNTWYCTKTYDELIQYLPRDTMSDNYATPVIPQAVGDFGAYDRYSCYYVSTYNNVITTRYRKWYFNGNLNKYDELIIAHNSNDQITVTSTSDEVQRKLIEGDGISISANGTISVNYPNGDTIEY